MTFSPIGQIAETRAQGSLSEVGGRRGTTVCETSRGSSSEIGEWLKRHSPRDTDKQAVWRAQSHGVALEVKTEGRYPTGPNGESLPSYTVAVGCRVHGTDAQRAAAKADIEKLLEPAPKRQIEDWLAELSVLTAGRGQQGFEAELALTAYASRLASYPADVARCALLDHRWKFFPAWAELQAVCDAMAGPRRHMIAELGKPEPEPEPARRPPTEAERERIASLIAEKFPDIPQHWRTRALDEVTKGNCMAGKEEGAA